MRGIYPDAVVHEGVISCTQTGAELPSYEGLCLTYLDNQGAAVMFTELTSEGRCWYLVHFGAELNSKEIELFSKGKQ